MSNVYVLNGFVWFGSVMVNDYGEIVLSSQGWKIRTEPQVDGTDKLVFVWVALDGSETIMYNFSPPSSLSTS